MAGTLRAEHVPAEGPEAARAIHDALTPADSAPTPSLDGKAPTELVASAAQHHLLAEQVGRALIYQVCCAGDELLAAKAQIDHGELASLIREHFGERKERTCEVYMQIARYPQRAAVLKCTSIRQALWLIEGKQRSGSLSKRFIEPPISPLSRRSERWRQRAQAWRLALGIESELGRDENLLGFSETIRRSGGDDSDPGTSVFDPVLCELSNRWFCPPCGRVLDPFAGGSVRGVVAGAQGFEYTGIELRPEQVAANREQAEKIWAERKLPGPEPIMPCWISGAAQELAEHLADEQPFDFLLSSPPYGDLERYSDDPRDLSNMPYGEFRKALRQIIAAALGALADDAFAAIVVGDIRDSEGYYRNLPGDVIGAFEAAGARLYNPIDIVRPIGSAAKRARRDFESARKVTLCAESLLVFAKGDWKRACEAAKGAA